LHRTFSVCVACTSAKEREKKEYCIDNDERTNSSKDFLVPMVENHPKPNNTSLRRHSVHILKNIKREREKRIINNIMSSDAGRRGRRGSYGKVTKGINTEILNVALVNALTKEELENVKELIEKKGVDSNLSGGYRPSLTIASIEGHIDIAKYLILNGSDINRLEFSLFLSSSYYV